MQQIYDTPIVHEDGRFTCADDERCLPFFAVNDGCSICVAVCPFNRLGYERLHRSVETRGHAQTLAEVAQMGVA